ncbi:hypothetical protein VE26_08335 [Devosia chinhatensis]|uniref:PD-(D/E)XK endonuclease-like domain-containing protein n=1 Tax=Devosia chinhatensis TaxID=429727 RepID=A0A0F5FLZ8_9HYPH|nr:hypothetical protein VE26_08335 [Devosia chinhatensis]
MVNLQQESLTAEQVAQACRALPNVQTWTTEAATVNLPQRSSMSAREWGNNVHWAIHKRVEELKRAFPSTFANIFSELSVDGQRLDSTAAGGPRYGQRGTTRLDIVEKVNATMYCVYDVKTGTSGLSESRILEILSKLPKDILVYIVEVRPFE